MNGTRPEGERLCPKILPLLVYSSTSAYVLPSHGLDTCQSQEICWQKHTDSHPDRKT